MDLYVLGNHDGDLPTHLLAEGEEGHRVRAMARLEGPDHSVFYALEVPDAEAGDRLIDALRATGTEATRTITRSTTSDDLMRPPGWASGPIPTAHIPPVLIYHFIWLDQEHVRDEIEALTGILGESGVAAVTDGEGHFLVEIGSDDQAAIDAALDVVGGAARHEVIGGITRGD